MSGATIADLNRVNDPDDNRRDGAIRRMAIKVTSRVLWQLVGYRIVGRTETLTAETFPGVGVYARPPASSKPEAIVVFIHGAKSSAVVATRDEKTRARVAGGIGEDETMVFNGQAIVYVKANGTVEIRSAAVPLVEPMLKADTYRSAEDMMLSAISAALALLTAGPVTGAAATAAAAAVTAIGTFQGAGAAYKTTVLKGQ